MWSYMYQDNRNLGCFSSIKSTLPKNITIFFGELKPQLASVKTLKKREILDLAVQLRKMQKTAYNETKSLINV